MINLAPHPKLLFEVSRKTPWHRVPLGKLVVAQLVKKCTVCFLENVKLYPAYTDTSSEDPEVGFYSIYSPAEPFLVL
jgi:hypothetical protein